MTNAEIFEELRPWSSETSLNQQGNELNKWKSAMCMNWTTKNVERTHVDA
jgi:hypothetical protein